MTVRVAVRDVSVAPALKGPRVLPRLATRLYAIRSV